MQYTPTAYKTGLAPNWRPNYDQLGREKVHNPWVMPHRSDVTLYHELVHAFHTQTGVAKEKGALVGQELGPATVAPVDDVDAPYEGAELDQGVHKGVSLEEYATVGLGPSPRTASPRTATGPSAATSARTCRTAYYTNKDERGRRAGS